MCLIFEIFPYCIQYIINCLSLSHHCNSNKVSRTCWFQDRFSVLFCMCREDVYSVFVISVKFMVPLFDPVWLQKCPSDFASKMLLFWRFFFLSLVSLLTLTMQTGWSLLFSVHWRQSSLLHFLCGALDRASVFGCSTSSFPVLFDSHTYPSKNPPGNYSFRLFYVFQPGKWKVISA